MIRSFHEHRNIVVNASRQIGKSLIFETIIKKNSENIKLGSLIPLSIKEKIVAYLEGLLVRYATNQSGDLFWRTVMGNGNFKMPVGF
jgi:hypothetical protein